MPQDVQNAHAEMVTAAGSAPTYAELAAAFPGARRTRRHAARVLHLFCELVGKSANDVVGAELLDDFAAHRAEFQALVRRRFCRAVASDSVSSLNTAAALAHAIQDGVPVLACLPAPPHRMRPVHATERFPRTWQGLCDYVCLGKAPNTITAYRSYFGHILIFFDVGATSPIGEPLFGEFDEAKERLAAVLRERGYGEPTVIAHLSMFNALHRAALRFLPRGTRDATSKAPGADLSLERLQAECLKGLPQGSAASARASWRAFLRFANATDATPAAAVLGETFDGLLEGFLAAEAIRGIKDATLANHRSRLRSLQAAWTRHLLDSTVSGGFAPTLEALVRSSGLTFEQVAAEAGIGDTLLHMWSKGHNRPRLAGPKRDESLRRIARLEDVLRVPEGYLLDLLGSRARTPSAERTSGSTGRRDGKAVALTRLSYNAALPARLQGIVDQVVRFHTGLAPGRGPDGRQLARAKTAVWRPNEFENPTEVSFRNLVGRFFGWLRLPNTRDEARELALKALGPKATPEELEAAVPMMMGKGYSDAELDFCQITDDELIDGFLWFIHLRNEAWSGHHEKIIARIKALVNPQWGWLAQNVTVAWAYMDWPPVDPKKDPQAFAARKKEWREHCEETWGTLNAISQSLATRIGMSRDPKRSLAAILELPKPVKVLMRAERRIDEDAPQGDRSASTDGMWLRDRALLKIANRIPLRVRNFAIMTWRADGSGHLYQRPDGSWWVRFQAREFKNARGAARDGLDVQLPEDIWPAIEEYLRVGRPHLSGAGQSDRLFLTRDKKNGAGYGFRPGSISVRLEEIIARYLPEFDPFRGHAWRHIIATDWLKSHPNDFLRVALILHDKLETVLKVYGHLRAGDGLAAYYDYLTTVRD